ncbi:MAG TPA: [LysW]-aminoadipate kinase [Anaerolineales bacterium]|jgi:acetylglutamate/LysW-gamma-L-alpha-aminoadipate kinase|nr:[LysW]-aminoadipate kinase [Anaerolineales bacterium]
MFVVKIGGAADMDAEGITADIAAHARAGEKLIIVHGGSALATELGEKLGYPPRFVTSVSGHSSRYTDRRTLEIFLMATALLNRQLVAQLQTVGVNAAGLSGLDGQLLLAERKATLRIVENGKRKILRDDYTGRIQQVNLEPLRAMLDFGLTPVIAPVAISAAGEPLNVDGDRAAAQLAAALGAKHLLILSNVPGLLRNVADESSCIAHLPAAELENAIEELARGRMKRKLIGAREALQGGVTRVVLADGRKEKPVTRALQGEGTVIQ